MRIRLTPSEEISNKQTMELLRIGIIGLGNIGTAHACAIAEGKVKRAVLCAVCDTDPVRRSFCQNTFGGVKVFEDYKELIAEGIVDAVIVSTPHRLHAEITGFALSSGLHALTEKPVDIAVSRARELNVAAEKSGRVFAIMLNQRTNPLFIRLKELVSSGRLGRLKSSVWTVTDWYRTQYYYDSGDWRATWSGEGGGVLLNQAVHNLDIWQWICGMPSEITAFCDTSRYHDIEVEDAAAIFARYPDGSTGTFITSTGELPGTNRFEVSAEYGKAVIEDGRLRLWLLPQSERDICSSCHECFPECDYDYSEYFPQEEETAHVGVLNAFVGAVLDGTPLVADGCEGINELEISNAAYLSQWQGNIPVKLPIDGELFDRLLETAQVKSCGSQRKASNDKIITGGYSKRWH